MLLDLVLIGALVRVLFGAARTGVAAQSDAPESLPLEPNETDTTP